MDAGASDKSWTDGLSEEDLAFIKRFVLASGSLKETAWVYGVSYPTVRLRLNRLIDKIGILDSTSITSDFERTLRMAFADSKIDAATFKALLAAHNRDLEVSHESPDSDA